MPVREQKLYIKKNIKTSPKIDNLVFNIQIIWKQNAISLAFL